MEDVGIGGEGSVIGESSQLKSKGWMYICVSFHSMGRAGVVIEGVGE